MDIAILNYPTGEVDILSVDNEFLSAFFADEVELFLEDQGYNVNDIHYMCAESIVVNQS